MKPLLVYATLVGLPVAGLAAVLHTGRSLHAPPSIGGEWRIEGREMAEPLFTISQSGTHVRIAIARSEFRGELRGDSLVAESTRQGRSSGCWNVADAVLRGRIDQVAAPVRMTFALEPGRPGCGGPFTAVRR